jgi:hypothetical protein
MKSFAIVLALVASVNTFAQVVYTDSADLSSSTTSHQIVDAEYKLIPTKVTTRPTPGCVIHSENYPENCQTTVVLESTPAIVINVSYVDSNFTSEGNLTQNLAFTLKPEDFNAADVAALKAASPAWKHPFSNAGLNFAKKNLTLNVVKAKRSIQIVDVRNSHLCSYVGDNYPEVDPSCTETVVYKTATSTVKEVSLHLKK